MKEKELIKLGFKRKNLDSDYWFEFKVKNHLFLTNDTSYNKGSDEWMIGYESKNEERFWFNDRLTEAGVFKIVFHLLTGMDFKLAHQKKLVK